MRILVAQINPTIGDLQGNTAKILQSIEQGKKAQADIVLFPEMALSGYPPEDFLLLPHFMQALDAYLEQIIAATSHIAAVIGLPRANPDQMEKILYDSAAIIFDQKLLGYQDKVLLPTYDVFDEKRYFEPGGHIKTWAIGDKNVAITICEDLWQHSALLQLTSYRRDPVLELKAFQPDLLLNVSASPYSQFKFEKRVHVCVKAAETLQCPVILCNQVGGNDSLIFDGYSLYVHPTKGVGRAPGFVETDWLVDTDQAPSKMQERNAIEDLFHALRLGVRDYFHKQGFKKAALGLSGGIDSAVVACIAAEALGADNVLAVLMPSRYSSSESRRDALALVRHLGMAYKEISIEEPFNAYLKVLEPQFEGKEADITEENLQSRIRGMLLMALSNKLGYIILNTGNKSELATGYSTLYGDMCGALSVINDLTKQQVYALANWINRDQEIIPIYTLTRPPSAELRFNQKDSDSLPDYVILDQVLQAYIEEHHSPESIAKQYDYPLDVVQDIIRRVHRNEYKRRQAPPGLRISEKAFSIGRRFPIVQKWVY